MTTAVAARSRTASLLFALLGTASVVLGLIIVYSHLLSLGDLSGFGIATIVVTLGSGACLLWASRRAAR